MAKTNVHVVMVVVVCLCAYYCEEIVKIHIFIVAFDQFVTHVQVDMYAFIYPYVC